MSATVLNESTEQLEGDFTDPSVDTAEAAPESNVPEQHSGKTTAELSAMLVEAERFRGKQANEVGELRQSVDKLIQAQLAPAQVETPVVEEEIDFFADPDAAIDRKIQNHPDVVRAREQSSASRNEGVKSALLAAHPDMEAIVADEAFGAWVQASPIRQRLLHAAHNDYDFDSANELFSNWKERAELATKTIAVDKRERSQTIKAAGTGSGSSSQAGAPKKKYRRTDIIRLMTSDPERYASMSDEIFAAYAEGRVIS
jgi:hypothetical protein